MTKNAILFLALALSLVLAGCTHENGADDVELVQMMSGGPDGFSPKEITIAPGTTVMWRNADTTGHNVVGDDGWGMRANLLLNPGETFEHTFTEPGEYIYYCTPHADPDAEKEFGARGMVGRVIVADDSAEEPNGDSIDPAA